MSAPTGLVVACSHYNGDVSHFSSELFNFSGIGGLADVHPWYIVLDKYARPWCLLLVWPASMKSGIFRDALMSL